MRAVLITAFLPGLWLLWAKASAAEPPDDFTVLYRELRAQQEFSPAKDDDISEVFLFEQEVDDNHYFLKMSMDWCDFVQDKEDLLFRSRPMAAVLQTFVNREADLSVSLKLAGYPPAIVDQWIGEYERAVLSAGPKLIGRINDHAIEDALFARIEAWRVQNAVDLPPVELSTNCGGHQLTTPVRFAIKPKGRLYLIPDFWFLLCKAKGGDPYNVASCGGWIDVSLGGLFNLGGDYVYQGIWRDKPPRRGPYRVEIPSETDPQVPVIMITPD